MGHIERCKNTLASNGIVQNWIKLVMMFVVSCQDSDQTPFGDFSRAET